MNTKIKSLLLLLSFSLCMKAQTSANLYCTEEDRTIFNRYLIAMEAKRSLPEGELRVETARFFLGVPYVASTLEKEPEGLVINLREMDCMTLVENVVSLVRTLKDPAPSFDGFCRNLQLLRYRDGVVSGYTDRLHYTTDWIYENERKGLLKDVSREIGGVSFPVHVSFMSTHPDSYRQLKNNPEQIRMMAEKEKEINSRSYYYIPEMEINRYASGIKGGDVVCFATTINGLDISHVGIACHVDGKLTFLHASTTQKQVIVNEDPLQQYVESIKRNSGVLIVRPQSGH